MAIDLILSSDTLESGFRRKANSNFNEIIQSIEQDNQSGNFRFLKNGGGFITLKLTDSYYTRTEIAQLLAEIDSSPYSGAWSNIAPYDSGAVVDFDGKLWRSNSGNNSDIPGTTPKWDDILDKVYVPPAPLGFLVSAGQPDTKILTEEQVDQINSYGRLPNFVAKIYVDPLDTTKGWKLANDIDWISTPNATPPYTSIQVFLHQNGGTNPDDTYIQFS